MRKKSMGLCKRVLSISLAAALIVTSLQITVNPSAVKEAEAAAVDANYDTKDMLTETYVKDTQVLRYYKILANAQRMKKVSEVSGKPASQVLADFTSSDYTGEVGVAQLIDYSGKINFSGLSIGNVSGIGWARSAEEIDLSGADFATPLTEVPANEFASCKRLVKIILPETVTKIGNNAFESCLALKTLVIGSGVENVVDLSKVAEVGASAFRGCSAVEAVTFSSYESRSTELKIGEYAFISCGSLKEIEIPVKKAENIGANAFASCAKLERAGLQNELTYLSNSLFAGAGMDTDGITMYIIGQGDNGERRLPENITYIGNSCFHGAKLTGLDLTNCTKLTTINERAFAGSHWTDWINTLEPIVLPENLRKLEPYSFEASRVTMIRIPESCSVIGESAFARSWLAGISLPKSLKKIERQTFEDCDLLSGERIQIADGSGLEEIGDEAFYGSQALDTTAFLEHLTKLTTIGDRAFASCSLLDKNAGGGELKDLYGASYALCGLREIILPDCVKTIGKEVFANNYALRTADLGAGVTVIPERAFYNDGGSKTASTLEKVVVSAGLTDIGKEAFANQSRLHTIGYKDGSETKVEEGVVQFKEGLLTVGEKAFSSCGMQSNGFTVQAARIYVPKGKIRDSYAAGTSKFLIYDYENGSMDQNFCRVCYINEEDVIAKADLEAGSINLLLGTLTKQGKEKYDEIDIIAKEVRVTCDYDTAPTTGAKQQVLEVYDTMYDTVTNAYSERFYNEGTNPCRKWYIADENKDAVEKEQGSGGTTVWCKVSSSAVSNVKVAGSTNVSMSNFSYVFGIRDVKLPNSVIEDNLGAGAFENCINLNEVKLSDNLKIIKDNTFSGSGADIKNPYSSDTKARYYDYVGLRTVEIPDGIQEIGVNAFKGCRNLTFPAKAAGSFGTSVVSIGDSAFADCYSLDTIRFPSSLEKIGKEAFARCAEKETDAREIQDQTEGSKLKYRYYRNLESYGTKSVKKGLNEIEFSAATKLQTVGAGAFKQTNVEVVNLAKSPLVQIQDSLFEQCTWLKAITFQNDTESLGSNVLKDAISLVSVTLPASATMKSNTISGAFGKNYGITNADPAIVLEYDKDEKVIIPVGSSKRLPINVFNKNNVASDPAPAIEVDTGDPDEHNRYKNIIGKENAYNGVYAEFVLSDEKDKNAPCSFILYGTDYAQEMTVRVVANTYYQECGFAHGMVSNYTISFKVGVQEQPTEKLDLSAEEDTYVKKNPSMYIVKGTDKTLYVPNGQDPATKGVTLKAKLEPVETTDDVVWTSSNPGLIEISDVAYEKGSGVTTAVIKTKEIGDAEITVQSGQKKDTIHVYSVIPVAGSNGLTCSTGGTILNQNLKPNSENAPYGLAVGDADQFAIKLDYGNTDYTEEQIASYGEKIEFVSSDPSVVSVNPDGTFKAQKEGTATVTVTALGSGSKLQFYFNVDNEFNYAPTSVQVNGDTVVVDDKGNQQVSVNVDETVSLSAKVVPERASQEVTWQVTNGKDVISVDDRGIVTGLKRGTGKVVAVSKEKESVKSKEITVTVNSPAKELYILCGDVTLQTGSKKTISKVTSMTNKTGFYISPVDSTDAIEWTSSDPAVFTVKSNAQSVTLTAVGSGTAILTGRTASGVTASITVTVPVKKISVTGITVDKEITLNVKGTHQLSPQILPANANETVTFTYTSSDVKIASVSASGLITAVAPGTATITAKTNTNKSATCRVTVNSPATKLKALMKNKPSVSKVYMAKGQTASLRVDKTPVNSTDTLQYKSNKPKIVTVSASGSVTAKKKGTAKITVTATSKKKATITIIVSNKQVKGKKVVVKAPKTIKRGKKTQLKVSLKPAKSTDTLSFATSNSSIATVDECGYVTGVKKGTVTITVKASSGKQTKKKIKIK